MTTLDDYISQFPAAVQELLQLLRATIKEAAPAAQEKISYKMPTFMLNGQLIYFAAWKNHIGLYATTSNLPEPFKSEFALYAGEKGALLFPHDQPLPLALVSEVVKVRVAENLAKPPLHRGEGQG
jgi:uncharacterized protein YdhG (YjbR/CyaY superfamily)